MTLKRTNSQIVDILFWGLVIILVILYLLIHISDTAMPAFVRKGIDCLIPVHFAAILIFPVLLWLKGVRLLWRILFLMAGVPVIGLSLMGLSTWFLQSHRLCMKGNGYAPLIGFWLFVPYFTLATIVVILDIIFTFFKSRLKAAKG